MVGGPGRCDMKKTRGLRALPLSLIGLVLVSKEFPDSLHLNAVVHEQIEELNRVALFCVDALLEILGVLTPEQREILIDKWERGGNRRWRR
jgi:Spy/CpxP family protein refolding chaperone